MDAIDKMFYGVHIRCEKVLCGYPDPNLEHKVVFGIETFDNPCEQVQIWQQEYQMLEDYITGDLDPKRIPL